MGDLYEQESHIMKECLCVAETLKAQRIQILPFSLIIFLYIQSRAGLNQFRSSCPGFWSVRLIL